MESWGSEVAIVAMANLRYDSQETAMWRVIIRISYFHDHGSRLRNHVATLFAAMGLQNTNTGTWESASVPIAQATAQLAQVLQTIANPTSVAGADPQALLNHLWVYIDRA
jgi:hypothetical protein